MSSESRIVRPLNSISFGCAGSEPVATTMFSAAEAPLAAALVRDRDRVRVDEARGALEERDVVPQELVADDASLALDHLARPHRDVLDEDLVLQAVALPVDRALARAR